MVITVRQLGLPLGAAAKAKLPTNLTTNKHPVHRWMNFIAGFSPEFVSSCIQNSNTKKNFNLIDPFAGLSTSLVQANLEGLPSVGFEVHPFFIDISRAKLGTYTTNEIHELLAIAAKLKPYKGNLLEVWSDSAVGFLEKLIPETALRALAPVVVAEEKVRTELRPLYRLIFSRVLELTSSSLTDGIYKAPTTRKGTISFEDALKRVTTDLLEDIDYLGPAHQNLATLHGTSSEKMTLLADGSCSICVTSPPYLNNFDFAEMTRMQLYFWRYAGSWGEITERVRRKLIVNTTTAPTDLKRDQAARHDSLSSSFLSIVEPLVQELEAQKRVKAGKKDYYLLVYPYFSQMSAVFSELHRVLRPGSSLHLVVADSALYGVHIEAEKLLAHLMEEQGFYIQSIENLRTRGDRWILEKRQGANKPLGEFHIHAVREK